MAEKIQAAWIAVDSFIRSNGVWGIILVILAVAIFVRVTRLKSVSPKLGAEFDTDDDDAPTVRRRKPAKPRAKGRA